MTRTMNTTVAESTVDPYNKHSESETFHDHLMLYVGISIGAGIIICIAIILCILLYKRGTFRRIHYGRRGTRRLFLRGFSTVSQRGVIDSTAEFEMVHTGTSVSVSSDDAGDKRSPSKQTPKKPDRHRSRTPSASNQYENVTLDASAGFIVKKTPSMNSSIQFIDNTLGSHISERDEDLDDVFLDNP